MKNIEQTRGILTALLLPKKEWFDSRAEWYEEAKRARAKAHHAVAMAAKAGVEELDVVMPSALVTALREISCAPAIHWTLDLVARGIKIGVAVAITDVLDTLQMEEDKAAGHRPWGWSQWGVQDGALVWETGSGRTLFEFGPSGATLERYASGGKITGQWRWSREGTLVEGWIHQWDDRAGHLTTLLGAVGQSPESSELAQAVELQVLTAEHRAARKARKVRARRKAVNTERAARARNRTIKRNADRRRKAADTWDRPVA